MSVTPIEDAFRELVARGLVAAHPAPRAMPVGNSDRQTDDTRESWQVTLTDGTPARLTLGRNLKSQAARHAAFAAACPDLATKLLFHIQLAGVEALAEAFFEGTTLDTVARDGLLAPAMIRGAMAQICQSLAATDEPSDETARQQEWQAWSEALLALPCWQPADKELLTASLLPALYAKLSAAPAATRWTNGDFLPTNILLDSTGAARLIDVEFAQRTHFFAEDAVRFRVLSPLLLERPELELETVLPPPPNLDWHLYFWLRQLLLEAHHNTPAYLDRVLTSRLALIRSLAEQVLGLDMTRWSVPSVRIEQCVEDIRWEGDTDKTAAVTGWCFSPEGRQLRQVVALDTAGRQMAAATPQTRPDVQQHYGGDGKALISGYTLILRTTNPPPPIRFCAILDQGTRLPLKNLSPADFPRGIFWDRYADWADKHDPAPPPPDKTAGNSPLLFSVLLPVFRTPNSVLHECIGSVLNQYHQRWELCIVDDGSASPDITRALALYAQNDTRIRVKTLPENGGISRATNEALQLAGGDFIVLLDHDDVLRPHALAELAAELARRPELDALYSDEDKITADGRRLMPFLKPDFSPEFLRGVMYPGHVLCVRTAVARTVGFDPAFDGVQDFEFFLRLSERTNRIGHVPRILYHWRQTAASSALHGNAKGNMDEKQAAAVQAHLHRIGDKRRAIALGGHRVQLSASSAVNTHVINGHPGSNALNALREAARFRNEEVLIWMAHPADPASESSLSELALLASLPDSGCVAPVFLNTKGRVLESGRIGDHPIMRGFHAESDGYNGTLRCNREVDEISPLCFAIRRSLLLAQTDHWPADWRCFCRKLRSDGLYHRICAGTRLRLREEATAIPSSPEGSSPVREFYNPHFDAVRADYSLRTDQVHRVELHATIDQPSRWDELARSLIIRGWCFTTGGKTVSAIRLKTDRGLILAGVTGFQRPDVKAALPQAPDDNTGFEIRGTLPVGRNHITIEAQLKGETGWLELATHAAKVHGRTIPLWMGGGSWQDLMFFQMPAHMAYAPRPIAVERFSVPTSGRALPGIAIVTPSYNQARFLPETMRGVLDQTGVECEYVVQDGGSTDGSVDCIKAHSSRMKAWASERDAGQADAIAKGFAKTTGRPDDLMAWINSDDFYLPGALAYVADYFARHPDVDVLYGHRIVINEESKEIARWFLPKHDPTVLRLNDFVPQETMFWRRRIWDRVGGIDTSFKFAMDWDLLLRFQAAGAKIVRVPRFLACFRIHATQKTSAQMHSVGQDEITRLRERTFARPFPATELETNPTLLRYLRRSAFIEFLWKLGIRAP
jgi:glycosyltransferase involved in cell wall biosynthesis